ncbi:MAG: Na(+)-translocating NADH-quinone reductase subunit C [Flavobacteriaceae bacterium]|nr:Na(+)-translocating NADH-quinone reductase subunit C [Flavobacteriaceae bacterium]
MAEKRTDTNSYTIIFSIIMVIVVGAVLAFVASTLNGKIVENQKFEAQQNILYVIGINNNENPYSGEGSVAFIPATEVQSVFDQHIVKQYVFEGDKKTEDDQAYLIDTKKEEQLARNPNYQRKFPLLVGEKDNEQFYIIPMRGVGLWDAIWGYMAISKDMTVKGVYFDHAGETPGLGANIKERYFMDDFHGEKLTDANNNIQGIKVAKGNMDPLNQRKEDHKVDAIAGSTITGDGVSAMITQALELYEPYLNQLIKEK